MSGSKRSALVTGASAGIGTAFARLLAAEGYDLLLVARREDRLRELAGELSAAHGVRCEIAPADLTDRSTPLDVMARAEALRMPIDVLINNAGLSGNGKFAEAPWKDLADELQLMVTAVTELARRAAPGMKQRGWGRIVNLSSVAAFAPPGASLLYTGIKSYVLNMSQALDMELKPHGVRRRHGALRSKRVREAPDSARVRTHLAALGHRDAGTSPRCARASRVASSTT